MENHIRIEAGDKVVMKKDVGTIAVIVTILAIIGIYYYAGYREEKKIEVKEILTDHIYFKVPPGFRELTKEERRSHGFSDRVIVLTRGDFERMLIADVETGMPEKLLKSDIEESFSLTKDYLEETVDSYALTGSSKDEKNYSYSISYQGKSKEDMFDAVFYSRIEPRKKFNITISGPQNSMKALNKDLEMVKKTLKFIN